MVAAVSLIAIAIRAWHLIQIRNAPFFTLLLGDAISYTTWARELAAGDWIGSVVFYQAPLYPYFLGSLFVAFGYSLLVVKVVQILLGALSCAILAVATTRLFGIRAGFVAGVLLALYSPAVYFDAVIQKTVLDSLLLCGLLAVLANRTGIAEIRSIGLGLLLGALALNRENTLLFGPLVAGWLWSRTQLGGRQLAVFALGLALWLVPVTVRNYRIDGGLHITTAQFGPNLFIGNSESATGTYVPLQNGHGTPQFEREDAYELAQRALARPLSSGEVSAYWRDRAIAWAVENPKSWSRLFGKKLLLTWNAIETADTEDIYSAADYSWPLRSISFLNFGVLGTLGLAGMWLTRQRWRELWIYYSLCAVYTLSTALFYVFARYRFPLVPLLVIFAAYTIAEAITWWRHHGLRDRLQASAIVIGAAVLCNWPLQSIAEMRSMTSFNTAVAFAEDRQPEKAIDEYRRAIRELPANARARANLGGLLTIRGAHDEALEQLTEAVRLVPDMASARTNLGIERAARGEVQTARAEFNAALAIDPRDEQAHYNLGVLLASQGELDSALMHLREAVRLDPKHVDAQNNLGVLLAMTGNYEEAAEHFTLALNLNPGSAELTANRDRALAAAKVKGGR